MGYRQIGLEVHTQAGSCPENHKNSKGVQENEKHDHKEKNKTNHSWLSGLVLELKDKESLLLRTLKAHFCLITTEHPYKIQNNGGDIRSMVH